MQVTVLQKLRENESCKRTETSSLNAALQGQLNSKEEDLQREISKYHNTKALLETTTEKLEKIKQDYENVKNELLFAKDELDSYEKQLVKERKKLSDAKEQRENTMKKVK